MLYNIILNNIKLNNIKLKHIKGDYMEINEILSKFQRVYKSGTDQWQCLCPVHNDKSPSVGIKYTKDGRILIHCFSGCETNEILNAVGLSFDDLFPNKLEDNYKPIRKAFNPYAVLTSLSNEILLCVLAAMELSKGKPLNETDQKRLVLAYSRIKGAYELCH